MLPAPCRKLDTTQKCRAASPLPDGRIRAYGWRRAADCAPYQLCATAPRRSKIGRDVLDCGGRASVSARRHRFRFGWRVYFHVVRCLVHAEPRSAAGSDEAAPSDAEFTAPQKGARRSNCFVAAPVLQAQDGTLHISLDGFASSKPDHWLGWRSSARRMLPGIWMAARSGLRAPPTLRHCASAVKNWASGFFDGTANAGPPPKSN